MNNQYLSIFDKTDEYRPHCDVCGGHFDDQDWDDRHTDHEPGCPQNGCDCDVNYHDTCCPLCNTPVSPHNLKFSVGDLVRIDTSDASLNADFPELMLFNGMYGEVQGIDHANDLGITPLYFVRLIGMQTKIGFFECQLQLITP